ncbi:MAG: sarcosine oxidase subunit delta [Nocardioidaceae bacterium]
MIILPCPWCGARDSEEFGYVGELSARPDPGSTTPEQWRAYLYLRTNSAGWTSERWYHRMGCRRFLTVERNTTTNEVRSMRDAGRVAKDR